MYIEKIPFLKEQSISLRTPAITFQSGSSEQGPPLVGGGANDTVILPPSDRAAAPGALLALHEQRAPSQGQNTCDIKASDGKPSSYQEGNPPKNRHVHAVSQAFHLQIPSLWEPVCEGGMGLRRDSQRHPENTGLPPAPFGPMAGGPGGRLIFWEPVCQD